MDAVSSGDFLSTTEALAKESSTKCRDALGELDFEKLTSEISLLVGISEKAVHVCRTELQRAADPLIKSRLTEVTTRVNSGRNISLSCLASLPYLTLPYFILPCSALPYLTLPYLTLPCLAVPCLALPCLTLCCFASYSTVSHVSLLTLFHT